MTPSFYNKFQILKRAISAFNLRCECEKAGLLIEFTQQIDTNDCSEIPNQVWVGKVKSDIFGDDIIFGTVDTVSQYLEHHIMKIASQIIESMAANTDDWYADKPKIQSEIISLYKLIKSLGVIC